MKKLSKLLLLSVVFFIITTTIVGCGTVRLNNGDEDNTHGEITPQDQWWVGTYDFVSFFLTGQPDSNAQILINYDKKQCPSATYGNTIVINEDGTIIDTQWGCLNPDNDGTSYGTYTIVDESTSQISFDCEVIVIKRPATSPQSYDSVFFIGKNGLMIQGIYASENFYYGHSFWERNKKEN